jgi:hypothetical protein
MPTEIRRLIFSNEELAVILNDFIASRTDKGHPGRVLNCDVAKREPLTLRARVHHGSGHQDTEFFEEVFLCAAIISWCMKEKVPLARKAKKAVRLTQDGRVALDVTLA